MIVKEKIEERDIRFLVELMSKTIIDIGYKPMCNAPTFLIACKDIALIFKRHRFSADVYCSISSSDFRLILIMTGLIAPCPAGRSHDTFYCLTIPLLPGNLRNKLQFHILLPNLS